MTWKTGKLRWNKGKNRRRKITLSFTRFRPKKVKT